MFPEITGHRFFLGRGMTSDDTEHTCLVAQALIASGGDVDAFTRSLAWRLRFWMLGLPAGIGVATLRALIKLWIGFPPSRSGVFSAGNGPAMRSAIIGVWYADQPEKMRALVRASTRLTHTDPKAEVGALAVAIAASGVDPEEFPEVRKSVAAGETTEAFAASLGLERGVTGYVNHTVPVALHACLRYPNDFRAAVLAVIRCGGDTDTVAAITGAILGARLGESAIPAEWLSTLAEWPRTVAWMRALGAGQPVGVSPLSILARNLFFLVIVLLHGLRRLFPPY